MIKAYVAVVPLEGLDLIIIPSAVTDQPIYLLASFHCNKSFLLVCFS